MRTLEMYLVWFNRGMQKWNKIKLNYRNLSWSNNNNTPQVRSTHSNPIKHATGIVWRWCWSCWWLLQIRLFGSCSLVAKSTDKRRWEHHMANEWAVDADRVLLHMSFGPYELGNSRKVGVTDFHILIFSIISNRDIFVCLFHCNVWKMVKIAQFWH